MFSNSNFSNTTFAVKNGYLDEIAIHLKMDDTIKVNRAKIINAITSVDSRCPFHSADKMYMHSRIITTNLIETAYLLILADEVENFPQFIGWLHNDLNWKNRS